MSKNHKLTFFLPIAYLVVISILLVWHGSFFSPDQFFAAALLITLIMGKSKQFIMDWSVPVTLVLSYEYLRGLVPNLSLKAHVFPMINFDKTIFGNLPTNTLQYFLFSNGSIRWYDYLATFLYMSHFIVPMLICFIFWLKNKKDFRNYSLALLLVSYLAFATYIVFPAMPPWMAAQQNFIPEVAKIMDKVFANFPQPINLPSVYQFVGANLVAAVPSLHGAYPLLAFLFIAQKNKVKSLFVLPYVLGVWLSIVYLGEHYVFDIVIGGLYAVLVFSLVIKGNLVWQRIVGSFNYLKGSI